MLHTTATHGDYLRFLNIRELINVAQISTIFAATIKTYCNREIRLCNSFIERSIIDITNPIDLLKYLSPEEEQQKYGKAFSGNETFTMMATATWVMNTINSLIRHLLPINLDWMTPRKLMEANAKISDSLTLEEVHDNLAAHENLAQEFVSKKSLGLFLYNLLLKSGRKSCDVEDLICNELFETTFLALCIEDHTEVLEKFLASDAFSESIQDVFPSIADRMIYSENSNDAIKFLVDSRKISENAIKTAIKFILQSSNDNDIKIRLQMLFNAADISELEQCILIREILERSYGRAVEKIQIIMDVRPIVTYRTEIIKCIAQKAFRQEDSRISLMYIELIKKFVESESILDEIIRIALSEEVFIKHGFINNTSFC